jgi:hypothetical protein
MDLHTTNVPFAADLPKPLTRAQIDLLVRRARRDRARAQADLILALGRFLARQARRLKGAVSPARVAWR